MTDAFPIEVDRVNGIPVRMLVCSLGGHCEYDVRYDPRDSSGASYADVRPYLVMAANEYKGDLPACFTLSFGR